MSIDVRKIENGELLAAVTGVVYRVVVSTRLLKRHCVASFQGHHPSVCCLAKFGMRIGSQRRHADKNQRIISAVTLCDVKSEVGLRMFNHECLGSGIQLSPHATWERREIKIPYYVLDHTSSTTTAVEASIDLRGWLHFPSVLEHGSF